jgi:hypothetical protein
LPAIDDVLPRFDVHEVHSIPLALPPARALEVALAAPVTADPLVRALYRLRGLRTGGTIGEALTRIGMEEVVRSDEEVVFAGAGRPWRLHGEMGPLAGAGAGTVRIAAGFSADGSRLTTETRIAAVDGDARRAFRRYWLVVGPFSALIRRRWLARIAAGA